MEYCVYMHIAPNGKKYVGITKDIRQRWCYGNGYKNHKYFWKAIVKYGWDNFQHIILLDNLSAEQAKEYEKLFIALFNSNNPEFGYNLTKGGDGISGYKHTKESKDKIGKASHERKRSQETRKRMSQAQRGKTHICTLTKEQRKVQSDRAKMQWQNPEYKEYMRRCISGENNCNYGKPSVNRLKVRCINTGEIFDSVTLAAEKYNIQQCHISGCCKGKRKTCGGLMWEYA
jgi:group I intron endonuclease